MIRKAIFLILLISSTFCITFLDNTKGKFSSGLNDSDKLIQEHHLLKLYQSKPSFETYKIEENPFKNWTVGQARKQLGAHGLILNEAPLEQGDLKNLPEHFDWREKNPDCISEIRNQANCGSCWAFALTNSLQDRFCIQSAGETKVILSPQDLVSCDTFNYACNGGNIFISWVYVYFYGVVSDDCKPYVSTIGNVPPCERKCQNPAATYKKYYTTAYPKVPKTISEIKNEIITNGPVESGYIVYLDFYYYKSGVYKHSYGDAVGGHAIKIIGWGKDDFDGSEYWIVANSWGPYWGDKGYFKIGVSECKIDTNVNVSDPKLK